MNTRLLFKHKGGRKRSTPKPSMPPFEGYRKLLPWQEAGFSELVEAVNILMRAPVGSGKSFLALALTLRILAKNKHLRCIICVPQTIIAPGFTSANLLYPDGKSVKFSLPDKNNLCRTRLKASVKALTSFLEMNPPPRNPRTRIMICTHSAMREVFKTLMERGNSLLTNLLIWIDESHHVATGESSEEDNKLGKLISWVMEQPVENNCRLGLMSGSFFREDGRSIIPPRFLDRFSSYEYAYDEYLKDIGIELSVSYCLCTSSYAKAVNELLDNKESKFFVYIPHPKSNQAMRRKGDETNLIIKAIGNKIGFDGQLLIRRRHGKDIRILDLVDDSKARNRKKEFLARKDEYGNTIINRDKNAIDGIVAMNMAKEGFDWIWGDKAIVLGHRSSLGELMQICGRILRQALGKSHTELYIVLPVPDKEILLKDDFDKTLSEHLKALFVLMMLEEAFDPIDFDGSDAKGNKNGTKHDGLMDLKEHDRQAIIKEAARVISDLYEDNQSVRDKKAFKSYLEHMRGFISQFEVPDASSLAKRIWAMLCRYSMKQKSINTKTLSLNDLSRVNPLSGIFAASSMFFLSAKVKEDSWEIMRRTLRKYSFHMSWEEAKRHVRVLGASRNDYDSMSLAERRLKRPLRSRNEWLGWKDNQTEKPEEHSSPILPSNPKIAYKESWKGWSDFLGKTGNGPVSIVEKPRASEKYWWVLTAPEWFHKKDELLFHGTREELSKKRLPIQDYEPLSSEKEATLAVSSRRTMVTGLPGVDHDEKSFDTKCITDSIAADIKNLRGKAWIMPKRLKKKYGESEAYLFKPLGNSSLLDGKVFLVYHEDLEVVEETQDVRGKKKC